MKKIFLIGLVIFALAMMSGCAATPKLYVPESELPKTKFLVVEVRTYKEAKEQEKGQWIFNEPIDEEYSGIFKSVFEDKLKEYGFDVLSQIPANKNIDFLTIKVSMANKLPSGIAGLSYGYMAVAMLVYDQNRKLIFETQGGALTSAIFPASYIVKKKTAPGLAEMVVKTLRGE